MLPLQCTVHLLCSSLLIHRHRLCLMSCLSLSYGTTKRNTRRSTVRHHLARCRSTGARTRVHLAVRHRVAGKRVLKKEAVIPERHDIESDRTVTDARVVGVVSILGSVQRAQGRRSLRDRRAQGRRDSSLPNSRAREAPQVQ